MKPDFQKGQLITWKDDRGFGFIKPDQGGKEVFLHISALKKAGRRPKVGDTIQYEQVSESDGKISAAKASILGVVIQPSGTKRKNQKGGLFKTVVGVAGLVAIALLAMQYSRSRSPSPITQSETPIIQPNCVVKGNISIATGDKLYHIPGMEDYDGTVIDSSKGERWFCSESEAIAAGWRKAPR